jgi:hypothetical protein
MSDSTPAGWYDDPNVAGQRRYWDGTVWTDQAVPAGDGGVSPAPASQMATTSGEPSGLQRLTTPERVSAIAMIVVVIAAFLPWASVLGISASGVEGDGIITLVLAIAGAAVLVFSTGLIGRPRTPGKASQITLLVLAVLIALVGLLDMSGFAAIGLYLTFFAGIAWVVGAIWQLAQGRQLRAAQTEASSADSST